MTIAYTSDLAAPFPHKLSDFHPKLQTIIGPHFLCPVCQIHLNQEPNINCANFRFPTDINPLNDQYICPIAFHISFNLKCFNVIISNHELRIDFLNNQIRIYPNRQHPKVIIPIPKDLQCSLTYLEPKLKLWLTFS